jgi:hypothetical protein
MAGARPETTGCLPALASARPALLGALRQVLAPDGAAAASPVALEDPAAVLKAVRRHRLAIALAPHADALGWPAEMATALRQEAHRQQRASLPLIATALEVMAALQAAGLPVLLLKGPALAAQTTGQAWNRGGGDLDLLVAPDALPRAMAVLERLGFESPAGMFPRNLTAFWGRYARWAGHELSLRREGSPWLDLHWALNTVRAPLPGFEALWREREVVRLNGRSMPTLSRRHAFLHGCLHAASDQWMDLRHLLDLARLAQSLPPEERERLRHRSVVRRSCAAAHDATGAPALLRCTDLQRADCQRAIARARWAQERSPRASADGAWHLGHWLQTVFHQASLSRSPIDWLRVIARYSLLPAAFNDPLSGRDVGLARALRARQRRLRERLQDNRLPGSGTAPP